MFLSLKYMLYTFIWYIWPKWLTQKGSRVMFTFQLLLLFRNWTLCRCLLVRCSLSLSLADVIHSFLNEHGWRHWIFTPLSADRIPTVFLVYHNSGQFFRGSHLQYDHREPVRQRLTQQRRRRVAVTWLDAGTSKRGLSRDPAKQNSPERRDNHHTTTSFRSLFVILFSFY